MKLKQSKLQNTIIFFFHPLLLALYVWLAAMYFSPNYFQKYKAEVIESKSYVETTKVYFHDLDGDTLSEKLHVNYDKNELVPEIVYFDDKYRVIGQWNLRGNWLANQKLFFGDYDHNGFKEVYCFTRVNDSIFLNSMELLLNSGFKLEERFICTTRFFNGDMNDTYVVSGSMIDIDKDGFDEFVFILWAGLSHQPRNIFAYYLKSDSLVTSPQSASGYVEAIDFLDLNNDGIEEITGFIAAPENIKYPLPYTDSSAWLMVTDPANKSDFLFPPIEFKQRYSSVNPVFYHAKNKKYIACVFDDNSNENFWLQLYSNKGELLKKTSVSKLKHRNLRFLNQNFVNDEKLYLIDNRGTIMVTDTTLQLEQLSSLDIEGLFVNIRISQVIDIDNDGKNEIVFSASIKANEKLLIIRSNLKDYNLVDLPDSKFTGYWRIDKRIKKDTKPVLVFQADGIVYQIMYTKSKYYLLKYPAYFAAYLLLFLVFWGLQKLQNIIAKRRYEIEKQLMTQQLTISKNQLEPHFLLNTLNNIGFMFSKENKDDAQFYFGRFASLIHRGLQYADQVETTLYEELRFIDDYLVLQQNRFDKELEYCIEADEMIDLKKIKIPHSLVYTFVENAIKHGLRPKEKDRKLEVFVRSEAKGIQVTITDNGIGRKRSKDLKTMGTGKGMLIAQNIVASYNKIYNRSISYHMKDLFDDKGVGNGTAVNIKL